MRLWPDRTFADKQLLAWRDACSGGGEGAPGTQPATTFDLLGFTDEGGRSRQGKDVVREIATKDRFAGALKLEQVSCKRSRQLRIEAQREYRAGTIRGHCAHRGRRGTTSLSISSASRSLASAGSGLYTGAVCAE